MNDYASSHHQRPRSVATGHTGISRRSSVASRQSQLIKKNTGQSPLRPCSRPTECTRLRRSSHPCLASVFAQLAPPSSVPRSALTRDRSYTGPHELRPSDILIERFQAWKRLVKNLIAYFEGIADIESNTAKELTKLGGVIQVPFREGNQFLGEGGVQDIFFGVVRSSSRPARVGSSCSLLPRLLQRERTRLIADHHANLAKTVEGSIVQHLQKLRTELKAHIKNIQQDTGKLAASVAKERELSTKMITDLARSITMLKNTPMGVHAKEDPWCVSLRRRPRAGLTRTLDGVVPTHRYTNSLVARQLQKQVHEENALQKSIIIMQQNSEHFEEGVVRAIQMAWSTFDEWNSRASSAVQETWQTMGQLMRSVAPTTEWIAFASRSEYLLDPDTPLRNPMTINYPGKDDPSVIPVHQGILERKKRYTKTYKESFYILTPAGYLHEHLSSDLSKHPSPELSLFLPECTLGAPSNPHARSHKFHIEGKKALGGGVGQKNGLFAMDASFTFRARSHDEMLEWWNDCKQLSKVYLTASEPFDRSGPVPAAVRAAGYVTDEDEEEEGGSSVEEETDEEEEEEDEEDETDYEVEQDHRHHAHHAHGHAQGTQPQPQQAYQQHAPNLAPVAAAPQSQSQATATEAPPYSVPAESAGIQLAPSGYALEKKGPAAPTGPGPESNGHGDAGTSGAPREEVPSSSAAATHAAAESEEDSEDEDEEEEEEAEDEEEEHHEEHAKPGLLGRFVEALGGSSSSSPPPSSPVQAHAASASKE
ncbi:SPOSA6832_04959, partial [Sporobolomyces salmonicolor]